MSMGTSCIGKNDEVIGCTDQWATAKRGKKYIRRHTLIWDRTAWKGPVASKRKDP